MCAAVRLSNTIAPAVNKSRLISHADQVIKEDGTCPLAKVRIHESSSSCVCSYNVNCLVSHEQEEEDSKLIANQLIYDALQKLTWLHARGVKLYV